MKELPRGWERVRLENLGNLYNGGTPSTKNENYWDGDIPWVTGADITSFHTSKGRKKITQKGLENSSTHVVGKDAVLIVTRTGVGKVSIAENDIAFSQDITALECKEDIEPSYIARYIWQIGKQLKKFERGATIKGITRAVLNSINIPLPFRNGKPDLDKQRKIVSILEKAEETKRLHEEVDKLIDEYLKSVFNEMFGDPSANPKEWTILKINDIVEYSQYGTSKKSNDSQIGYPVLGMNNITYDGRIDLSDLKYVDLSEEEFKKNKLEKGDVIFNRTNSTELVGKTTYWNLELDAVIASYLVKLRLTKDIDPICFSFLLNTEYFKELFMVKCKKAVGQSNISPTLLKRFPIYLPPINLQSQFAKIIEQVEHLRSQLNHSKLESETLFNALMQKAFTGELVA